MARIDRPTKVQLACNVIRALFFDPSYKGVIPKYLIKVMLEHPGWYKTYGKKVLQEAWLQLQGDGYVYLKNNDVWIWGIPGSGIREENEKQYAKLLWKEKKIKEKYTKKKKEKRITLQDLHKLVDNASDKTIRDCLKEILQHWFINTTDGTVDLDKDLGSDQIMEITVTLQDQGFYPES